MQKIILSNDIIFAKNNIEKLIKTSVREIFD